MRVEVRDGAETLVLDPLTVEDDVRDGRLPLDALVRLVPGGDQDVDPAGWPTEEPRPVRAVAALAPFADAPAARVADRLRHPTLPWATAVLLVALVAVGAGTLSVAGREDFVARFLDLSLGFVPSLVDAGWWTPWTAAFLHVGLPHLVGNLAIVAYCGWRVERVHGPLGVALACAAAVLGATPLVLGLSDLPVVGASTLAFGLLGMQVGTGFRLGDAIPAGYRSPYGFGNLVISLPLFVLGMGKEGVSDTAHVGGLLGGFAAALLVPIATTAPAAQAARARARGLAVAAALALAPMVGVAAAARSPLVLGGSTEAVTPEGTALTLQLPTRLAQHPYEIAGVQAWSMTDRLESPLFAALFHLAEDAPVDDELLAGFWRRVLGAEVEAVPVDGIAGLGDGWTVHRFRVGPFAGFPDGATATVHVRARGRYAWELGWFVAGDHALSPGLERWYAEVASTVRVGEPPDVAEARKRWDDVQDSPEYRYRLAVELLRAGEPTEAHALVGPLLGRDDGWQWDAMRVALAAWEQAHALELPTAQVVAMADEAPGVDLALLRPAFAYLVARGECGAATRITAKLAALGAAAPDDLDADDVAKVLELAQTQQAALTACATP